MNKSMTYIRGEIEEAYYRGALAVFEEAMKRDPVILSTCLSPFKLAARADAKVYAQSLELNEKALRCANSEEPKNEESTNNLHTVPITPGDSAQLPPLAADLEGLAVSIGVLAGKVNAEEWEFLKVLRSNIQSAAEQAAELENNLEIPSAGRKELA